MFPKFLPDCGKVTSLFLNIRTSRIIPFILPIGFIVPSYISLHTALSFYGMIPEAVVQITCVTSLKTASFTTDFGEYSYKNVKDNLMFGYELKPMADKRNIQFATPEKALLDLLYLYPFYDSKQELEELRLDEDYLHDDLNKGLLTDYCDRFQSKALDHRLKLLFKTYDL